jgi:uncharacterized protein (TIGR00290 family)
MHVASQATRAFVSFSGGKDSMLALHRAREQGVAVEGLLCVLDESEARSRSHGVPRALVEAQARALGLPCVLPSASWGTYEATFVDALRALRARGIEAVVFGDIDLAAHRAWEEGVCRAAGLRAILPLWQSPRADVVADVLRLGYRARVVCVAGRWLDESFAGRLFDASFVADLPPGVDACGENGEFHTFVFDGPLFSAPVAHRVARVRRHDAAPASGEAVYYVAELD